MQIIRGNSVECFEFLKQYLVLYDHQDRDAVVEILKYEYQKNPENWFILLAFNEDTPGEPEFLGFIGALLNPEGDCYFPQVYAKNTKLGHLAHLKMLQKLYIWAEANGCKNLIGETNRDSRAVERLWGWKEYSKNMILPLTDGLLEKINLRITKEISNGRHDESKQ